MNRAAPLCSFRYQLAQATIFHPAVQVAIGIWITAYAVVLMLAHGRLPFDRPAVAELPFALQLAAPTAGMIEIFLLMAVVFALTRRRELPDITARAPDRRTAMTETLALLGYAAVGQAGGWILGPLLGCRPFSFHIAGTLFGHREPPPPRELWTWAIYNFVVFAVIPYVASRRRYSDTQLNLRSTNRGNDLVVIVVICILESGFELGAFNAGILSLSPHQLLLGVPLSLFFYGIGTVLPTMVLIYAILIPRFLKLTGSMVTTTLLGGLTYSSMHLVEGWSNFSSTRNVALSLIFVLLNYLGPGIFKSFVTLRTGNAWVHAIGYHAIAPHVIIDTPLLVRAFRL